MDETLQRLISMIWVATCIIFASIRCGHLDVLNMRPGYRQVIGGAQERVKEI